MTLHANRILKLSVLMFALAGSAAAGNSTPATLAIRVTVVPTLLISNTEPMKATQQADAASFRIPGEQKWDHSTDVQPVKVDQSAPTANPTVEPHRPETIVVRDTYVVR